MDFSREAERARTYLGLGPTDVQAIRWTRSLILSREEEIIQGVLNSLLSDQEAVSVIKETGLSAERAVDLFRSVIRLTLTGDFDSKHARRVFIVGAAHLRAGVGPRLMIQNAGAFTREVVRILQEAGRHEAVVPAIKVIYWTLSIIMESYLEAERRSLKEASGLKPELVERLKRAKAQEIYEEFRTEGGTGPA